MASFTSEPPPDQRSTTASERSKQLTLLVMALTGLMLVLDITITNVALPTIQRALGTTTQQLGVALGMAALTTLATGATKDLLGGTGTPADPAAVQAALTGGYAAALRGAALVVLAGAALSVLLLPSSQPAPDTNPDTTTSPSGRPA